MHDVVNTKWVEVPQGVG